MPKAKHESTVGEMEESLKKFRQELQECKDLSSLQTFLIQIVQHLTPAESIRLLLPKNGKLSDPDGEMTLPCDTDESLVQMAIDQGEALLTNDVRRDGSYDAKSDNPGNYPLKSLLIYPFFQSDQTLIAVLWAAIPLKNLNQFVSQDPEHLQSIAQPLLQCLAQLEGGQSDSFTADEPVSSSTDSIGATDTPALMDVIKSWLSGLKKQ